MTIREGSLISAPSGVPMSVKVNLLVLLIFLPAASRTLSLSKWSIGIDRCEYPRDHLHAFFLGWQLALYETHDLLSFWWDIGQAVQRRLQIKDTAPAQTISNIQSDYSGINGDIC